MSEKHGGEKHGSDDERRELEEAGWDLVKRRADDEELVVWRNPESGHLYPQEAALSLVRERARRGQPFDGGKEYSW